MLTEMFVKDHAEIIGGAAIITACLLVRCFALFQSINFIIGAA